jgi:hypothetical protein
MGVDFCELMLALIYVCSILNHILLQIIEGAITIGFGVIAWFFLPNFPDQNIFLTREETRLILQRVEHDRGDSVPDVLSKEKLVGHLLDWKVWTFGTTSLSDWT